MLRESYAKDLRPPLGVPGGTCTVADRIKKQLSKSNAAPLLARLDATGDLTPGEVGLVYRADRTFVGIGPKMKLIGLSAHAQFRMDLRGITLKDLRESFREFWARYEVPELRKKHQKAIQKGTLIRWADPHRHLFLVFKIAGPVAKVITAYWRKKGLTPKKTPLERCAAEVVLALWEERRAGDIILYKQENPNPGRQQPGEGVDYQPSGSSHFTTPGTHYEPTDLGGPGNNTTHKDNMPASSAKVIPDSMKNTLQQQLTYPKAAAENKRATPRDILSKCSKDLFQRARKVSLTRIGVRRGVLEYRAAASNGGTHRIRIQQDEGWVRVSCSCEFWRWQGPEHWAKRGGYLYGRPRGTAASPKERDPRHKHGACKHVVAVLGRLLNAQSRRKRGSSDRKAARKLFWHGTSSKNLRGVLKRGLLPSGVGLVYSGEEWFGSRSLQTYGGAYFSQHFAYDAARTASRGNALPMIIGAILETRSPDIIQDEDSILGVVEEVASDNFRRIPKRWGAFIPDRFFQEDTRNPINPYMLGELASYLSKMSFEPLLDKFLDRFLGQWPNAQRSYDHQKSKARQVSRNLLLTYLAHLIEGGIQQNYTRTVRMLKETPTPEAQKALADLRNPPEMFTGTFQKLRNATEQFSRFFKPTADAGDGAIHNVRSLEPVGFSGKNRIVVIGVIDDRPEIPEISFPWSAGTAWEAEFLKQYTRQVGGPYNVVPYEGGKTASNRAPLYHFTSLEGALGILKSGVILPTENFQEAFKERGLVPGVSLTRRPDLRRYGPVRLVLDANKLRQHHKMMPFEFGMATRAEHPQYTNAEEFVPGTVKIKGALLGVDVLKGRTYRKRGGEAFVSQYRKLTSAPVRVHETKTAPQSSRLSALRVALMHQEARVPQSDKIEDILRVLPRRWEEFKDSEAARAFYLEDLKWNKYGQLPFEKWKALWVRPFEKVRNTDQIAEFKTSHSKLAGAFAEWWVKYMGRRGWFLKNKQGSTLSFESRRGDRVEVPRYLWHTTDVENLKSVERRGLLPGSRSESGDPGDFTLTRRYPDRVYLADSFASVEKIRNLLIERDLQSSGGGIEGWYYGGGEANPYVIFQVDTGKLRRGTKFYKDPDYKEGVYTYTPIPAAALTLTPESKSIYREWVRQQEADWQEMEDPGPPGGRKTWGD